MNLADIDVPDTPTCRASLEVATMFCTPALRNHSVRSYLWAAAYASSNGIGFDAELLYVAALLHDLALTTSFDSHELPFEEAGGRVAWVFTAGAGWPVPRRVRAGEVIVRHMWDKVDIDKDPEGYLLALSTGMDISGRNVDSLPHGFRSEVLALHPRLDLVTEFTALFEGQAVRKPDSSCGRAFGPGFVERVASNPLDARWSPGP